MLAALASAAPAAAQTDGLLLLDDPAHHFLEMQHTRGRLPDAFVSNQPLSAYEARAYLDTLAARSDLRPYDRAWIARLQSQTPLHGAEWAHRQWSALYPNGRDLFSLSGEGYGIQLNPLAYASLGRASQTDAPGRPSQLTTWRNTRGVRASGHVGDHVFFESRFTENQERPIRPDFNPAGDTAPRLGFTLFQGDDTYDYFTAMGMVGYRSRFFEVRFGRDRNRWGAGQGTLLLSDYASVYDQLQIRTTVGPIQYTNLFARFTQAVELPGQGQRSDAIQPRPYGAFHRLTVNVTDRLQLEAFEGIMFATEEDSTVSRSGFDVAYLNPIIFYRAVERDLGSPDNAVIGIGGSYVAIDGVQVYGQFLLDELVVGEIGNEWWGNKWGWMLGVHLTETGVPGLTARMEVARQRPYLYAHEYPPNAYVHYGDGLGHPAGPNSIDASLFLEYRPPGRLQAALNLWHTRRGRNTATQNFGADPTRDNDTRVRNRPVPILQGVRQNTWFVEAHVGVELLPRLLVDAAFTAQFTDDARRGTDRYVIPSLALRWGLPFASQRY